MCYNFHFINSILFLFIFHTYILKYTQQQSEVHPTPMHTPVRTKEEESLHMMRMKNKRKWQSEKLEKKKCEIEVDANKTGTEKDGQQSNVRFTYIFYMFNCTYL